MKVIAIDYDGTASEHPDRVRDLFDNRNHHIVIYTARPEYMRNETKLELEAKDIPYHSLVMGKIRADVYIDDKNAGGLNWETV